LSKSLFLFSLLIGSSLCAYIDSDFDGVEDTIDRCPNTPFSELVDITGCTTKTLDSPHHFDIIAGVSYSDSDYLTLNKTDTLSSSLQFDYYYKQFSLQLSSSYFTTEGDGYSDKDFYDTFLGAAYQFYPLDALTVRVGLALLLPTYETAFKNNNTDYLASFNASYNISKVNIFAGYSYSVINDDDILLEDSEEIIYQNSAAYSVGTGYYLSSEIYTSLSYNASESIYKNVTQIQTLTLYGYYSIDAHWFTTLSYARGLSDSASKNYIALRLGYFF